MILRFIVFLVLNFGALAIGAIFTGKGVPSDWYTSLNKAPWTPPGWMFGFAWTTIMICFSAFMALLWPKTEYTSFLVGWFTIQWILNVAWNPAFFHFHHVGMALFIILLLTAVIGYMLFYAKPLLKSYTLFLLPYFVWLLIATSLNAYILVKN